MMTRSTSLLLCAILFLFHIKSCSTTHFKGMTTHWVPTGYPLQVRMTIRTVWSRSVEYCDDITIQNKGVAGDDVDQNVCSVDGSFPCYTIFDGKNRCIAYSDVEDWSYVESEVTFKLPYAGQFYVSYASCCLPPLVLGDDDWSVTTYVDLSERTDLQRINNSPIAYLYPTLRFQQNCNHTFPIPASDPDGDIVRCRWSRNYGRIRECRDVCQTLPATLDEATCTVEFLADTSGLYVGAFMVEDFALSDSNFSTPLSGVPVQVMIEVTDSTKPCGVTPIFTPDTQTDGACELVVVGTTWTKSITVSPIADSRIDEIVLLAPDGLRKTNLITNSESDLFWRTLEWDAPLDVGEHRLCYYGIDALGPSTEIRCMALVSTERVYKTPTQIGMEGIIGDNGNSVHWSITFDSYFIKPKNSRFITVQIVGGGNSSAEVIKLDVIDSSVIYSINDLEKKIVFTTPYVGEALYYIGYDAGIATIVDDCGVEWSSDERIPTAVPGDRCVTNQHPCEHICNNVYISSANFFLPNEILCSCYDGYELTGEGICSDVDECVDAHVCDDGTISLGNVHGICLNTEGSYRCTCPDGYTWNNITCEDIDECVHDTSCEDKCKNDYVDRDGTMFTCACLQEGFKLGVDSITCVDVNECDIGNGGCAHTCHNIAGSYMCSCYDGYELSADKNTCIEIVKIICAYLNETRYCKNGAECKGRDDRLPYCACTEGFIGDDCATAAALLEPGEISGIAIGVLVILAIPICAVIILIWWRRRSVFAKKQNLDIEEPDEERYSPFYRKFNGRVWRNISQFRKWM